MVLQRFTFCVFYLIIQGMLNTIIPISIGAVGGAVLRHIVVTSAVFNGTLWGFSWGVLACNIMGSFAMGVFIESGGQLFDISPVMRLLIATGFLGSFTTFSAFSVQTIDLLRSGHIISAFVYVGLSVCMSLGALYLGIQLVKGI